MNEDLLIQLCFNEHVKDVGGIVSFTFEDYRIFWINHKTGNTYEMINRNGTKEVCKIVYYPLPYYSDLRALIEIYKSGSIDFREVPVRYLTKKT